MEQQHWVSCWGSATSISERTVATYAKDVTLRYPIHIPFTGNKLRLRFSNLTGTEPVTLSKIVVAHQYNSYSEGLCNTLVAENLQIPPGEEVDTEPFDFEVEAGETINVSIYLGEVTQMNAGTFVKGPLSRFQYSYGDFVEEPILPLDLTRYHQWIYFLNTIDILTSRENHCVVCYGDSLTAQSWPDFLAKICWEEGRRDLAVVRRGASGTRILRQYDCITYQSYGLKGATRFPIEMRVSGCDTVIIQHGANDMIHPVGTDVNPFRPLSDMPTLQELCQGMQHIYVDHARELGLRVIGGTLLPFGKWRTFNNDRETLRTQFNHWLLHETDIFDHVVDFSTVVADPANPTIFAPGYDSGDHLHPSDEAYEAMARAAFKVL